MTRGLLVVVAALAVLLAPAVAEAANRPFAIRYTANVNGQIITAANTMMTCPTDTVDPLLNAGCSGAHAGTNTRNTHGGSSR